MKIMMKCSSNWCMVLSILLVDTKNDLCYPLTYKHCKGDFMRISKQDAIDMINRASKHVTAGAGTPNPETRDGIYIGVTVGISSKTIFIGLDKATGEVIYEMV